MAQSPLWLFLCPYCDTGQALSGGIAAVECPKCRFRTGYPGVHRFGAEEWSTEEKPASLIGCFTVLDVEPSPRKRRLLYTAVARIGFELVTNHTLRQAIEIAEAWADGNRPNIGLGNLRHWLQRRMPRRGSKGWDWRHLALQCLDSYPSRQVQNFQEPTQHLFADAYRELFPNPFVPLEWNPEWFTSTVRDLAAHIYADRDFAAMPILADALQDAGCDHALVLDHCRTSKPHARGCWVVDAILGKT